MKGAACAVWPAIPFAPPCAVRALKVGEERAHVNKQGQGQPGIQPPLTEAHLAASPRLRRRQRWALCRWLAAAVGSVTKFCCVMLCFCWWLKIPQCPSCPLISAAEMCAIEKRARGSRKGGEAGHAC